MAKQEVLARRIETPQWYADLVDDLRELACNGVVALKHAIGVRMLKDIKKFGKPKYGSKKIEGLAKELNIDASDLRRCVVFAKKYPNLGPAVLNVSWRHIRANLLPGSKHKDKSRKRPTMTHQFEGVEIRRGDFREVLSDIEPHTVKLILTDPPYGKEYLNLWNDLGTFAKRVLRSDGVLIAYSGQLYLPDVLRTLHAHLEWWWMCAVVHQGSGNLTPLDYPVRKVINQFKPLLMFIPEDGIGIDVVFRDTITGTGPEKDKHNWQQPVEEAKHILDTFCESGDLIIDPFAGSGAFGEAARQLNMPFIGAEILDG